MTKVLIVKRCSRKDIPTLPKQVKNKLEEWIDRVEENGIDAVRKIPGYHDEPLKGTRKGERSARMSKGYRVIYFEEQKSILIVVVEVNKHDY